MAQRQATFSSPTSPSTPSRFKSFFCWQLDEYKFQDKDLKIKKILSCALDIRLKLPAISF